MEKTVNDIRRLLLILLIFAGISTAAIAGSCIVVVPKTVKLLNSASEGLTSLTEVTDELRDLSGVLQEAKIDELIKNTDALITSSTDTVALAEQKIEEIDIETLNKAISDLQTIVEPLAKITNMFSK